MSHDIYFSNHALDAMGDLAQHFVTRKEADSVADLIELVYLDTQ